MPAEEPRHPRRVLQPRLVDVQIHPVDAIHLERDVLSQDISDAAGYRHHKLAHTDHTARRAGAKTR